jgi:hypothetical protein
MGICLANAAATCVRCALAVAEHDDPSTLENPVAVIPPAHKRSPKSNHRLIGGD